MFLLFVCYVSSASLEDIKTEISALKSEVAELKTLLSSSQRRSQIFLSNEINEDEIEYEDETDDADVDIDVPCGYGSCPVVCQLVPCQGGCYKFIPGSCYRTLGCGVVCRLSKNILITNSAYYPSYGKTKNGCAPIKKQPVCQLNACAAFPWIPRPVCQSGLPRFGIQKV